jgi:Iap family predicted aminopeptidase
MSFVTSKIVTDIHNSYANNDTVLHIAACRVSVYAGITDNLTNIEDATRLRGSAACGTLEQRRLLSKNDSFEQN